MAAVSLSEASALKLIAAIEDAEDSESLREAVAELTDHAEDIHKRPTLISVGAAKAVTEAFSESIPVPNGTAVACVQCIGLLGSDDEAYQTALCEAGAMEPLVAFLVDKRRGSGTMAAFALSKLTEANPTLMQRLRDVPKVIENLEQIIPTEWRSFAQNLHWYLRQLVPSAHSIKPARS